MLHRVVDGQAGRHHATGRVEVEIDVLLGVVGLEKEQLGDDDVRDVVVDRRAEEHDAVHEQAREDVVGPLAAAGTLDDVGRVQGHRQDFASTTVDCESSQVNALSSVMLCSSSVSRPDLLELGVEVARRDVPRRREGGDALVDLGFRRLQLLLLHHRPDDQVAAHLRLGDVVELGLELVQGLVPVFMVDAELVGVGMEPAVHQ